MFIYNCNTRPDIFSLHNDDDFILFKENILFLM